MPALIEAGAAILELDDMPAELALHRLLGVGADVEREGRLSVYRIASPILPGSAPYRLILRVNKVWEILREARPDVIELGSMYTLPWTAFRHRKQHPCTIFGFYHTDFADVYVRPAAEKLLGETIGRRTRNLAVRYTRAGSTS